MKRNLKKIIATALVCAFFSGTASFGAFAAPKYVNITGEPVAVRSNPGTSAKFVQQVHYGDQMVYLDEKNDKNGMRWYKIKLADDKTGWVTSAYADTVDEKNVGRVEVTTKLLNVRKKASLTSDVLGITRIGSQFDYFLVKKDSSDQIWYQVHYGDDQVAWLLGTYCNVVKEIKKTDSKTDTKTDTKTDSTQVEITANPVNVRSKASLKGTKLGTTSKGKKFDYLASDTDEKGNMWYKIRYTSDKSGWVMASLSKIIKSEKTTDSKTTSKTTTSTTAESAAKQVIITATALNVRSSASISGKILATVKHGKKFKILTSKKDSKGKIWYQIEYKSGKKGWILSDYAELTGKTTASKTTTSTTAKATANKVRITGEKVNVRDSADFSGKKIGTVKEGKTFKYLAAKKDKKGNKWYQIQYTSKKKGWVLGSLSELITAETKTTAKTTTKTTAKTSAKQIEIIESPVNVRAAASTSSKKLGTTSEGKKYKYLATKEDSNGQTWYQIQYTSKTKGWVLSSFCKLVK